MPDQILGRCDEARLGVEGRCANCGRFAPNDPSVILTVAGEAVAYLCASCLPWDEDELFRQFEAGMHERYAGLPLAFAFWPMREARSRGAETLAPAVTGEHADSR
jgi:hypothetical protein